MNLSDAVKVEENVFRNGGPALVEGMCGARANVAVDMCASGLKEVTEVTGFVDRREHNGTAYQWAGKRDVSMGDSETRQSRSNSRLRVGAAAEIRVRILLMEMRLRLLDFFLWKAGNDQSSLHTVSVTVQTMLWQLVQKHDKDLVAHILLRSTLLGVWRRKSASVLF